MIISSTRGGAGREGMEGGMGWNEVQTTMRCPGSGSPRRTNELALYAYLMHALWAIKFPVLPASPDVDVDWFFLPNFAISYSELLSFLVEVWYSASRFAKINVTGFVSNVVENEVNFRVFKRLRDY